MPSDLDEQKFGMSEAALYGLSYPKLLRTQLARGTFECGTYHDDPMNRWTFSLADVLFLRLLNTLCTLGPGFDPSRMVPHAKELTEFARKVWEGELPADYAHGLAFRANTSPHYSAPMAETSGGWISAADHVCRMQITVPVGRIVQELREAIETPPQVAKAPERRV